MIFNLFGLEKESPALLYKLLGRYILQQSAFELCAVAVEQDLHVEVRTIAEAYGRQILDHFRKVSMDIYCVLVIQCSTNIHFVVNVLNPNS